MKEIKQKFNKTGNIIFFRHLPLKGGVISMGIVNFIFQVVLWILVVMGTITVLYESISYILSLMSRRKIHSKEEIQRLENARQKAATIMQSQANELVLK